MTVGDAITVFLHERRARLSGLHAETQRLLRGMYVIDIRIPNLFNWSKLSSQLLKFGYQNSFLPLCTIGVVLYLLMYLLTILVNLISLVYFRISVFM